MFERYLQSGHPASLAAEATMRMAIALMELGRTDEAKVRLMELVRRHEGTGSAARARRMLEELK